MDGISDVGGSGTDYNANQDTSVGQSDATQGVNTDATQGVNTDTTQNQTVTNNDGNSSTQSSTDALNNLSSGISGDTGYQNTSVGNQTQETTTNNVSQQQTNTSTESTNNNVQQEQGSTDALNNLSSGISGDAYGSNGTTNNNETGNTGQTNNANPSNQGDTEKGLGGNLATANASVQVNPGETSVVDANTKTTGNSAGSNSNAAALDGNGNPLRESGANAFASGDGQNLASTTANVTPTGSSSTSQTSSTSGNGNYNWQNNNNYTYDFQNSKPVNDLQKQALGDDYANASSLTVTKPDQTGNASANISTTDNLVKSNSDGVVLNADGTPSGIAGSTGSASGEGQNITSTNTVVNPTGASAGSISVSLPGEDVTGNGGPKDYQSPIKEGSTDSTKVSGEVSGSDGISSIYSGAQSTPGGGAARVIAGGRGNDTEASGTAETKPGGDKLSLSETQTTGFSDQPNGQAINKDPINSPEVNDSFDKTLGQIENTPSGSAVIQALNESGKTLVVTDSTYQDTGGKSLSASITNNNGTPTQDDAEKAYLRPTGLDPNEYPPSKGPYPYPDGVQPGPGVDGVQVFYDVNRDYSKGLLPNSNANNALVDGTQHEFDHAENFLTGTTQPGVNTNGLLNGKDNGDFNNDNLRIQDVNSPDYQKDLQNNNVASSSVKDDSGNVIGYVPRTFSDSNGNTQQGFVNNKELQILGKDSSGYEVFPTGKVDENGNPVLSTGNPSPFTEQDGRADRSGTGDRTPLDDFRPDYRNYYGSIQGS